MKYKIVDTYIEIDLGEENKEIWEKFHTEEDKEELKTVISYPQYCYGMEVLDIKDMSHSFRQGKSLLFADQEWKNARIYGSEEHEITTLAEMQLYSYLLSRESLLIHSSLVDYQGNGIMFIGPSGIGKTTQAELWNQYQGATILNGDLVFVRKNEDGFYGYGSPWHGSSPYYEDAKVKLKAMVMLEQGTENRIHELTGFERLKRLMDQVFVPHWQEELMNGTLETINRLLTEVPMYFLSCRPDEEGVNLLKKTLNV